MSLAHEKSPEALPVSAADALRQFAENLALARQRRKQSLRDWALRLGVSVPTLIKMEKGDPSVRMGVYVLALWMCGRHLELGALADPREDRMALEVDIAEARERGKRRSRTKA